MWFKKIPDLSGLTPKSNEIDLNVVNKLRRFQGGKKFKKEALRVITNMLTEEEVKQMRKAFYKFDIEMNGRITLKEFKETMKDLGFLDSEEELQKIICKLGLSDDHDI